MGKGICLPACCCCCCCLLLPTAVANLRLLFTIIQSIIQFNARLSRPKSQFIQLFMHCAGGTGQVRYSLTFFSTVFHLLLLRLSLVVTENFLSLRRSVALYTSSSSFTGPQMRHKIFLQLSLTLCVGVLLCVPASVCTCYLRRIVRRGEYKRFVYVFII